ncbi:hypothetical protein LIPSTDRAFT_69493, partial [Lipomyces starkeyi NRRL Y-11557]
MKEIAIKEGYQFKVHYSDRSRVGLVCKDLSCGWKIHPRRLGESSIFGITRVHSSRRISMPTRVGLLQL